MVPVTRLEFHQLVVVIFHHVRLEGLHLFAENGVVELQVGAQRARVILAAILQHSDEPHYLLQGEWFTQND